MTSYLVDTALLSCAQGTSNSSIKVSQKKVYMSSKAVVTTSETEVNSVFGKCLLRKLPNGDFLPCTYIQGGDWKNVKRDVYHNVNLVMENSKLICNQEGATISVISNPNKSVVD